MKTLLLFILTLLPLQAAMAESTTIKVAHLSVTGMFLTALALGMLVWLFKTPEKRKEATKTDSTQKVLAEQLAELPTVSQNVQTEVKLLDTNEQADTFVIIAKVNKEKKPKRKANKLPVSTLLVLLLMASLFFAFVLAQ